MFGLDPGYLSVTIKNHQFDAREISVPRDQPFVRSVSALHDQDLAISSPELGSQSLRVPASPESRSVLVQSRVLPSRFAKLHLGPLQPSRYVISCSCPEQAGESAIVVD